MTSQSTLSPSTLTPPAPGTSVPGLGDPTEEPHRSRAGSIALTIALVTCLLVMAGALGLVLLGNPFGDDAPKRSAEPVVVEIRDLAEFHAVEADFSVTVDSKDDVALLPDIIAGEHTVFVGVGTVAAYIDFSTLGQNAVSLSDDGKVVTVTLPGPRLKPPVMDPVASHVQSRQRGILNRIGGIFTDSPTGESKLYEAAQVKITEAAAASNLLQRAEQNTERMLTAMLTGMGFEEVHVVFTAGPAAAQPGG